MKNRLNILLALASVALIIPCFAMTETWQDNVSFVGSETCTDCHDDMIDSVGNSIHGMLAEHEFDVENSCEACHGAGEDHAFSDGEEPIPYPFNSDTKDADANAVCATCHIGGETMGWPHSTHSASGISCLECHTVKGEYSKRSLEAQNEMCATCHADQKAAFQLPSHHPLLEKKMGCMDCHNPHGSEETMLRGDTANDLCLDCHAEKHGPFMYEHEPVVEDCLTCHTAKGAMHNNLLKANETSLCLRCHAGHEDVHPNLNAPSSRAGYMTKCTRCHSQIHGSDLPGFAGASNFIR